MISRFTVISLAVVGSGLLASCGDAPAVHVVEPAAATTPTVPPEKAVPRNIHVNAFDDPSSPERITYSAGLVSDPMPASSPDVKVDQAQALKISAADPFGNDLQPGTPVSVLRLVTVGEATEANTAPAWVLVWKGVSTRINGKAGITQEQLAAEEASIKCLFVYVVDANSGQPEGNAT
jgi:hypothetical protein